MNTDAIKRFLTVLSSTAKLERGQLYQLIQSAEVNYWLRDIQSQRDIGLLLQSFTYPFNQVGKYYESIYLYRTGQYEKAKEMLEGVAESAPAPYRSKALLSLSTIEQIIGHFEESLRLRLCSLSANDPVTLIEAQRGLALLRSVEGDHRAALRDLERLMPVAQIIGKHGHPAYYTFLNSYALELSESGKPEEAENVANIVAASPFIEHYSEFRETLSEIVAKRKSRSAITVLLPKDRDSREPRVQAAISFMRRNLHRRIALAELAALVNLSVTYFSGLFKGATGISPGAYLIQLRMERAANLLATTFLSIKQITAEVGYNNKNDFGHHFKRHFDITPSKYRKRALTAPTQI